MKGFSQFALATVIAAAVGCTIQTTSTPSGSKGGVGTTQPIPTTQATAMVTGHVDASVHGNIKFAVNGAARATVLAPDESFVVRDVPSGDVTFDCDDDDVRGTLTITNVQPGEMIEVTITRQGDAIVIVIVTRTTSSQPPQEITTTDGGALEIDDDDVCYYLKPGVYHRDVLIKGHDVHVFGASHQSCTVDDVSVIAGTLTIQGDRAQVFDVQISGNVVITGHDDRIQDSCTSCFNDTCGHSCKDDCHGAVDAGTPVPSHDGGAAVDSGGPVADAGMPPPADGGAPDAPAAADAAGDGGIQP